MSKHRKNNGSKDETTEVVYLSDEETRLSDDAIQVARDFNEASKDEASSTLSFEEFKRALGPVAMKYTDDQIDQMRLICDNLANAVFDSWLEKRNSSAGEDIEI